MSLSEHHALLAKVETFQAAVEAAQQPWLSCRKGCDGCCRVRRSAWAVEVNLLHNHIVTLPPDRQAELVARRAAPEVVAGQRCIFLDADGACAVYAARPVICRTHGPAVRSAQGLSWCALNFVGLKPAEVAAQVPAERILDLDRLNTLLAVVNTRFVAQQGGPERLPLEAALDGLPDHSQGPGEPKAAKPGETIQ